MKLSKQTLAKLFLIVFSTALLLPINTPAKADQYDSKINELNSQISSQQAKIKSLQAQADTLNNRIAILDTQIEAILLQIQEAQKKADQLEARIEELKVKLDTQKEIFNENIRAIYKAGETSSLEVLASSDNFSDYVNKQEYSQKVKDKVQKTLDEIKAAKDELAKQQAALNGEIASQKVQQSSLDNAKAEQANLLSQTKGQESEYQQLVSKTKKELQGVYAARASYDAAHGTTVIVGNGNGGYPWPNAAVNYNGSCRYPDGSLGADQWGACLRQCTSFAAWHRHYYQDGVGMPQGWGNAMNWANYGPRGAARPGSIAVFAPGVGGAGSVGHVAIVLSVHGSTMDLAEYNWRPYQYSERYSVPMSGVVFIN